MDTSLNRGKIVECVPNFSEGRELGKIKQITDAIEAVPGIKLMSVEPGADTNRTVVTFVGAPDAVAEAAFQAIAKAAAVIDMSMHKGEHPRMGATDVCPFVPVEGVTMQDCVELARKVGERVGRELSIPVYLYEAAAARPERSNLADIRRGEYEGLAKKVQDPEWKPDFGPARFNAKSGATVIGAREFLIAYNITLNSQDKQHATEIAFDLREKGRVARTGNVHPYYYRGKKLFYQVGVFPCGSCEFVGTDYTSVESHCSSVHGYDLSALLLANELDPPRVIGQSVYRPGMFRACKAIGWYVEEFKRAQVSINLTDFRVTPPHLVLEAARKLAAERGLVVTGSEIVGLVPYEAMLQAGKYYLEKQGKSVGVPAADIVRTAVFSMGLADVVPFEIEKKVIGLPALPSKALVKMSIQEFADEVSRDTPAPGGGSIAALSGALGAALASMVANLTYGKEGTEAKDAELARIAAGAQSTKESLMAAVDADTNAFNAYMDARRMPRVTPEEQSIRNHKMQEGLKVAIDVPWQTAVASFRTMELARDAAAIGNPNSVTDAAVGVQMGFAGVRGGIWNVMVNLKDITDEAYVAEMKRRCEELLASAKRLQEEASAAIDQRLASPSKPKQA
ncbi:MAG: glutamate formimidoyltransferase [Bdellovibrionales bacterium GWB1_55_8]|nr:MAG: glutamate formimidoyltransferase [Bdellovibrionales bacterium GWB1_55_8]